MNARAYYSKVIRTALTHSIHITHGIIFILLIATGLIAWLAPANVKFLERVHVEGWEVGAAALVLIVAIRLVAAPFWMHREQARKLEEVERTLREVSEERPFTFVTITCKAVGNNFHAVPIWDIQRIDLVFENLSKRLLRFKVKRMGIEHGGQQTTIEPLDDGGTYIHGEQRMTYGADISGIQTSTFPFVLTISFDVHYDNVPALKVRGSSRKVRYTVQSFRPIVAHDLILEQKEYDVPKG